MKPKQSLLFLLIDLAMLALVLILQIGVNHERLFTILLFALTVRTILLSIILFIGFFIRKFIAIKNSMSFLITFLFGYSLLVLVYINENGFNYWKRTLINLHSTWQYFGQVLFPFLVASVVVFILVKSEK